MSPRLNVYAMKNARLYAIVLLAALALLQARVAFAGCADAERAAIQGAAGCCLEHAIPDGVSHEGDEAGITCAPHCAEPSNTASNPEIRFLVGFELAVPSSPPLLRSTLYPPSTGSQRLSASGAAHPPHTRLVYALQRLLI